MPDVLLISTKTWRNFSIEEKQILQEAVEECAQLQKTLWKEATRLALEGIREAGVEIHYPDKAEFILKVQTMYENFKSLPEIDTIIQQIKNIK